MILAGTNHSGLGPLQDGDYAEIEIEKIGRQGQRVSDEYKRSWDPHVVRAAARDGGAARVTEEPAEQRDVAVPAARRVDGTAQE